MTKTVRLGVCSACQTGGIELTQAGNLVMHKLLNKDAGHPWCDGSGKYPETTYRETVEN